MARLSLLDKLSVGLRLQGFHVYITENKNKQVAQPSQRDRTAG